MSNRPSFYTRIRDPNNGEGTISVRVEYDNVFIDVYRADDSEIYFTTLDRTDQDKIRNERDQHRDYVKRNTESRTEPGDGSNSKA